MEENAKCILSALILIPLCAECVYVLTEYLQYLAYEG